MMLVSEALDETITLRKNSGITQGEVAELTGMLVPNVSRLEKTRVATLALAESYQVAVYKLVNDRKTGTFTPK